MGHLVEQQREQEEPGGSPGRRAFGFRPAYFDFASQKLYLSRYADGRLAPIHVLEGLPEEAIVDRAPSGRVLRARASLVPGYEHRGRFYSREAAARLLAGFA